MNWRFLFLFVFFIVVLGSTASASTKIYVCGKKITDTENHSFSLGNGTVRWNNVTLELEIKNVTYSASSCRTTSGAISQ